MAKTMVALFEDRSYARTALDDLVRHKIFTGRTHLEDYSSGSMADRLERLQNIGMPDIHAQAYCEGVLRGGGLLIADVDEQDIPEARAMLQRDGAINVQERILAWQQEGWRGVDVHAVPPVAKPV